MKIARLLLTFLVLATLAALGALALDEPAPAKRAPAVVRAQAIELVDGQGRQRAQIKVEPSGEVVFRLRDQEGQIRVKLGASRDGSGLLLLDDATEPGIQALAGADDTRIAVRGEELAP
jgi:hypothetical protein